MNNIGTYHSTAGCHLLHPQHDFLAECRGPEDLRHKAAAACLLGSEFPPTEQHFIGLKEQRRGKLRAQSSALVP